MSNHVNFLALTISAGDPTIETNYRGKKICTYTVRVASDATNRSIRFKYHDSEFNHDQGVRGIAGKDLLEAFHSFVSDAKAGELPFEEFCSDIGYDSEETSSARTWRQCKEYSERFAKLWSQDRDPAEILELLEAEGVG